MKILHPIKSAVLCFVLLLLPGATHGQQLDQYGGFLDIKGKQTGFFHTERINDRWWLVTPEGHGFFGIGVSHPITSMSEGAITFAYDGSQEEWMRDGIRKMRELGFNCVWSGPYSLERIRFGNIDADLADKVYSEAKVPYAIHVPLIKHPESYTICWPAASLVTRISLECLTVLCSTISPIGGGLTTAVSQAFSISTASRTRALSKRSAAPINGCLIRFANLSTRCRSASFTILTMRRKPRTAASWNSDLTC